MFNYIVSNMCFISSKISFSAFQILSLSQGRPGWMRFHCQQRATQRLTTVLISLLPTHSEALTQTRMRLSGILSSPMSRKNFMPTQQTQGTIKRRKQLVLQSQSEGVRRLMTIGTKQTIALYPLHVHYYDNTKFTITVLLHLCLHSFLLVQELQFFF